MHVPDQNTIGTNLQLDLAGDLRFFKKRLWNSNPLRIADLNDLGFHNYFVITRSIG